MANFFKKRTMEAIAEKWGKEDQTQNVVFRDLETNYAHMMKKDDWILDDQTWNDLDMNRNYLKMNRTYTNAGQQNLYNMLRTLQFDEEELKRRERMMTFFQLNKEQREKIQCLLHFVGKEEYDGAASLLYRGIPALPKARAWVMPCTLGMIASLLSIPFLGVRSIILIAIFFALNIFVNNSMNQATEQSMGAIRTVARMLIAAREISKLGYPELKSGYSDFFDKVVDKCRIILKKSRSLGDNGGLGDPLGLGVYAQILFLGEARAYLRCVAYLEDYAPALRTLYKRLGELDAFQSMASVRRGMRQSCKPHFVDTPNTFKAVRLGHPGLKNAVCNDITIEGKNVVITGSNMSGKSTFLRTIGLNQVLAQTFYVTMAKSYETSWFNVVTSISPSDDMEEGKSYYMAEAQALLRMLGVLEEDRSSMLLIDEIFRGTNPLERVAGASAYLEYLSGTNAMVVVATHDEGITENLKDSYDSYHFEETVTRDSLEFDYLLKKGPLTRPNGIHILEYIGYPEEIITSALSKVGNAYKETARVEETDNENL